MCFDLYVKIIEHANGFQLGEFNWTLMEHWERVKPYLLSSISDTSRFVNASYFMANLWLSTYVELKTFAWVRYEFYEAKIGNVLQTYQMNF